jgi:putative ubiquitin-RnfH superfamily antitoxin RatB of RatAB toxin-antitoxin module
VWGRRCALTQRLNDGDRVEIYRPLSVDPKQARRLRDKAARLRIKQRPAGDERGSGGSGMGR